MASWENFYVIVGSSAAALIGMQFVVMTLIAGMRHRPPVATVGAFGTPTVVYLTSSLVVSAVMSVPWPSLFLASVALELCGIAGLTYAAVVMRRVRRQTFYAPVWQDWGWYIATPFGTYALLAGAAYSLRAAPQVASFAV